MASAKMFQPFLTMPMRTGATLQGIFNFNNNPFVVSVLLAVDRPFYDTRGWQNTARVTDTDGVIIQYDYITRDVVHHTARNIPHRVTIRFLQPKLLSPGVVHIHRRRTGTPDRIRLMRDLEVAPIQALVVLISVISAYSPICNI